MSRLNADIALILAAAVWGVAFLFQKSAMDHIEPLAFIAARTGVAAVALAPLAWREHRRAAAPASPAFWAVALWGGIAFLVAAWLQQAGLVTATVTNTTFLTALYVVLTPLVAWAWSGMAPRPVVWPAVVASALGTWLLGGGTLGALSYGDRLVAVSALFWAVHVVITRQAAPFGRPIAFTAIVFAVTAVLAGLGSALTETTRLSGLGDAGVDILYVGLLSSALTYTILTVALQYTPAAEAAVIVSMETVFAALAAFLVLGERLSGIGWVGAALILLATLLLQIGAAVAVRLGRAGATVRPDAAPDRPE